MNNTSIDFVDRNPISISEIVKSNMKHTNPDSMFGIKGYTIPHTDLITSRPRTTKFSKYSVPHFIDKYTKSKEFIPGPKYETMSDWTQNLKNKGKFPKTNRITNTESILIEGKLRPLPGPGSYDDNKVRSESYS